LGVGVLLFERVKPLPPLPLLRLSSHL
jgi:hypothetical protein